MGAKFSLPLRRQRSYVRIASGAPDTFPSAGDRRLFSGLRNLFRPTVDRDVEVHHVFADAEFRVEADGGIVAVIGLDEDDSGAAQGGDAAQFLDQRGRDPEAPMCRRDSKVIDIDLATRLFELLE